jgi:probable HAF family extracellular repeat protein
MRSRLVGVYAIAKVFATACLCALAATTADAARVLVISNIDFPGSVLTNAQGINAQGNIVGFYTDTAGRTHGFLQSGGYFRSIDYPNSDATQALGIGPAGDIVGTYQRPGEPAPIAGAIPIHGFLMTRRGGFFKVDYPGHQNTIAQRILPDGTILGCYHDADRMATMYGMAVSRHGFEHTTEPASMHNGATPDGQLIVGLFTDMRDNRGKAYMIDRGRFSALEVPGSVSTAAWDVNPSSVIVGNFADSAGVVHGFQYDGQAFGRVDVTGARATRVFGINAHGDMVGAFVDAAGRTHGFLAQWVNQ